MLLCPVDTGNLRRSITVAMVGSATDFPGVANETLVNGRNIKAGIDEVIIGTVVIYAAAVEFGIGPKTGQAFLLPAFNANVEQIKQQIAAKIKGVKWIK